MLSPHPEGTRLTVWVVPSARRSEVVGPHGDAVKVRVAAPAEGGRANRTMLAVLAERLAAPCRLDSGETHRRKAVVVEGLSPADVAGRLGIVPAAGADEEVHDDPHTRRIDRHEAS